MLRHWLGANHETRLLEQSRRAIAGNPLAQRDHGITRRFLIHSGRHALVKDHHDVAADRHLRFNTALGTEKNCFAIQIALKNSALLAHRAGMGQGEDLKSSGIGEHRVIPTHEAMNSSHIPENLRAWTEEQVVGIGEQDLRTRFLQKMRRLSLHCGMRSNRHEQRGFNLVMQRVKCRRACA